MTNHDNRKRDIGKFALPRSGSKAEELFYEYWEKNHKNNSDFQKHVRDTLAKASSIVGTQNDNGAGLPVDQEIRYFLREFNGRNFESGLNSMPTSFNIMEAFFKYRPEMSFFEMLEEEDYLFNLFEFIDYITSPEFNEKPENLKEILVDDLIYSFNITNSIEDLTFTTEDGGEYVLGGVSLVKRGNEAIVFLLTAELNPEELSEEELSIKNWQIAPGKESLIDKVNGDPNQVKLFNQDNTWKTLAYCRFDLEKLTIDSRYVQKDVGVAFTTITDDKSGLVNHKGEFLMDGMAETYESMLKQITHYSPLFELATKCLFLPYYFDVFNDEAIDENHETNLKSQKQRKSVFKKDNIVPNEYIIRERTVWRLDRNTKSKGNTVYFGDNDFKLERDGFWKNLDYNSMGKDKSGHPIQGRTWVERTQAWYEKDKQTLTVNLKNQIIPSGSNLAIGKIYIMRNASHDIDIFKIGLTTRDSKTRAKELSGTTGSPDKFLVANEWDVKDCAIAEGLIHAALDNYRINDRREFFKIDYKLAVQVIEEIVAKINNNISS